MRGLLGAVILLAAAACTELAGTDTIVVSDSASHPRWHAVEAGSYHTCALTDVLQSYCWGLELTIPCRVECAFDDIPKAVPAPSTFASIAVGERFSCGITSAREAYCWGVAAEGTLGDGTTIRSSTPVRVALDLPVQSIDVGFHHACAIAGDGAAYCWGGGAWALGAASGVFKLDRPGAVATTLKFRSISAGFSHTCAVTTSSDGLCWGSGFGALGAAALDTACGPLRSCLFTSIPVPVEPGRKWASISAGINFSCGVTLESLGFCWGAVDLGDVTTHPGVLGSGTFAGSKAPVAVAGGLRFRRIVAGWGHACGITTDRDAFCWGENTYGGLGIGRAEDRFPSPQRVVGQLKFASLSVGAHSCGLSVNHNLFCWGLSARGALGIGRTEGTMEPVPTRVLPPQG